MSIDDPDDPVNPYAPPSVSIGASREGLIELTEAEATRRQYLNHEASVQSIGTLLVLAAVMGGFFGVIAVVGGMSENRGSLLVAFFLVLIFGAPPIVIAVVGIGVRGLQSWSRWTAIGLMVLSIMGSLGLVLFATFAPGGYQGALVVFGIAIFIPAYVAFILVSSKSTKVFSKEYREIRAQTPHIKYQTSYLVRAFVVVFLLAVSLVASLLMMSKVFKMF